MIYLNTPEHLQTLDARDGMYPSILTSVRKEARVGTEYGTTMGYVISGEAKVVTRDFSSVLKEGAFFSSPGGVNLEFNGEGHVVTIERLGFKGFSFIGQREKIGRLTYIDLCSDSLLIYPPRMGDPCLNHLHFPKSIDQTQHTHPSVRLGVVAGGSGYAWGQGWEIPMAKGGAFILFEGEQHSFRTQDSTMDVIAYHPDSDWGPTDTNHPMLNRTYINSLKRP